MTDTKPYSFPNSRLSIKGEDIRQVKIQNETNSITNSICNSRYHVGEGFRKDANEGHDSS